MSTTTLRLGTRRSALAWVQSSQVAQALQDAHPGLRIELVGIETRGDRIQDVPLSDVDGKAFFTAEIDAALLEGRVDLTVHSLKDLSLERPAGLLLAAIPRRANPRDIAVFAADVPARLRDGAGLRIGTASPRRQQLLPGFFARAVPHAGRNRVELVSLRGNVDSRLRRLREPRGSERQLDGVVLALAGLSRLYADTATERQGKALLDGLLDRLPLMILPLDHSPAAPGQGALAIECRADDARTRAVLAALEHAPTRAAISAEREVLRRHGGGCHQRFGATQLDLEGAGSLLQVGGVADNGEDLTRETWIPATGTPPALAGEACWDGSRQAGGDAHPLLPAAALAGELQSPAVFLAHSRALPAGGESALAGRRVWTSGSASWFRLAAEGVWVEGCAEGLGAEFAAGLVREPVLRLPATDRWDVLTHAGAESGWQDGAWAGAKVLATYTQGHAPGIDSAALAAARHVYWSSSAQFEQYGHLAAPDARHACGPGKTAAALRRAGLAQVMVFPSAGAWRTWTAQAR
ncbi:MAG: hypothetical protein RL026_832 [Pseudomonadota bacterium]